MSLQFMIGNSGAGKTRRLYEDLIRQSIENPRLQYIAIVPEQFTMQTQKEIVSLHPDHGTMNIDIVSFNRLAYRIFEELAVEHLEVLEDMGKSMILRKVAAGERKNLNLFSGHLNQTGFINQLKSMLSELYQYGVGPERLREAAKEEVSPLLREKLTDLLVIYEAFQKEIARRYIPAEEILEALCQVLPKSRIIKNSVITLDGYTGFTPVQYRLLKLFMIHGRRVIVTVTADPREDLYRQAGQQRLFYMSSHMVCRLEKAAREGKVVKDPDILLDGEDPRGRLAGSPAIRFIERHLYRFTTERYEGEPEEVELLEGVTPGQETEAVAARIQELVQKHHVRYREIAVITADLAGYGYEITNRFQAEKIPYFMDDKKSIMENVMVEFIRSALEIVQRDFDYESVFRFLKTGLAPLGQEQIDRLENYVAAFGIRGYRGWSQAWEYTDRGETQGNLEALNESRLEFLSKMEPLKEAMADKEKNVRSLTAAVMAHLEGCQVQRQMEEYRQTFRQAGEYGLAKEYEQVYGLVMELFDRLVHLLGEERVSGREYAQILDAGFQEIRVGVIPATVDRVVVGDITRTRLDSIKVLFFMGVNEGIVPGKKEGGGILTDADRERLKALAVELAPTAREEGFRQRFYLYLMMTKPSRRLVVSYASLTQAGKAQRPSSLVGELRRMFPKLRVQKIKDGPKPIGSLAEGMERLMEGLRTYEESREKGEFLELYRYFALREEHKEAVEKLTKAAFSSYEERGIGRAAARALYGTVLQGSVTRLEQYAACAYAHFLSFGMELMERREYRLRAADMGNLFHRSIDRCFQELAAYGKSAAGLTQEERKALVKACVAEVAQEYGSTILNSSARNRYLTERIERMTDRTMWALAEHLKRGDFVPVGYEVSFSAIDNLGAMKIRLSEDEELHLRGRVDRMDRCEDEERVYVKIIDYKSGAVRFDLADVCYGLQLQLVVYLDAVTEMEKRRCPDKEVVAAGIFYYPIKDPVVDREDIEEPEDVQRLILEQLRLNGLVNSEPEVIRRLDRQIQTRSDVIPVSMKDGAIREAHSCVADSRHFEALKQYVRGKAKEEGREILAGRVSVAPYKKGNHTACDHCPYHGVCGFDQKVSGYGFRRFADMTPAQAWETIQEGGDER